jgi:hypothetical protein
MSEQRGQRWNPHAPSKESERSALLDIGGRMRNLEDRCTAPSPLVAADDVA